EVAQQRSAGHPDQQEDRDVQTDEDLGDDGTVAHHAAEARPDRGHRPGPFANALHALEPDRGLPLAVRADVAVAPLAADVGLTLRMAVAPGDRRRSSRAGLHAILRPAGHQPRAVPDRVISTDSTITGSSGR